MTEPLHVIAGTSDEESHEHITFQYSWPVKVTERLLENEEAAVLNVSPPFTTSYNGVQFTWALRLADECVVSAVSENASRQVLLHLYFKDGPCEEVVVEEVRAAVLEPTADFELMKDHCLSTKEFNKGSGWPLNIVDADRRRAFSDLVKTRIDGNLVILVHIKMKTGIFEPFCYLPDLETSQRIETHCEKFIEKVNNGTIQVPNMDLKGDMMDKYRMHRLIFLYGCDLVERDCLEEKNEPTEKFVKLIRSTFAHVYFMKVLMKEVDYVEDFMALLEGVIQAQIPPLKKEMERFICQEVMMRHRRMVSHHVFGHLQATSDSEFTKKMLLLAEKYELEILYMVATGVLVDQIVGHANPPAELVSVAHELKHLASEMPEITSEEVTVGSVVEDLQSLARRVRRVSLSHSPSVSVSSQGSSPAATPNDVVSLSPSVSDQRTPFENGHGRFKRVELA